MDFVDRLIARAEGTLEGVQPLKRPHDQIQSGGSIVREVETGPLRNPVEQDALVEVDGDAAPSQTDGRKSMRDARHSPSSPRLPKAEYLARSDDTVAEEVPAVRPRLDAGVPVRLVNASEGPQERRRNDIQRARVDIALAAPEVSRAAPELAQAEDSRVRDRLVTSPPKQEVANPTAALSSLGSGELGQLLKQLRQEPSNSPARSNARPSEGETGGRETPELREVEIPVVDAAVLRPGVLRESEIRSHVERDIGSRIADLAGGQEPSLRRVPLSVNVTIRAVNVVAPPNRPEPRPVRVPDSKLDAYLSRRKESR